MRMSKWSSVAIATVVVLVAVSVSQAQQRGRGGFGGFGGQGIFGGFGGGGGRLALLRMEAVQKELELLDDQKQKIDQLAESLRGQRGGDGGERPNFQNMSEQERQQFLQRMRDEAAKREAETRTKLADILLPHQLERLDQLYIQRQGVQALQNPEVQAKLKLTDAQKSKLEAVQRDALGRLREAFQGARGGGGGGDFAQLRERMESMRREIEQQMLDVLTAEQKQQFENLKGKPFEFPAPQFGPGGRGGRGRGGEGNQPNARPQRPGT